MFAAKLKLLLTESHPTSSTAFTQFAARQIWLAVHVVWVCHWSFTHVCTAVLLLLHCEPEVHWTQPPLKHMGVGAAHAVWLTHWLPTQFCGVLFGPHCMPEVHWTHDLATQNGVVPEHVVPQLPQLFGSELSSTHAF
jgi:hypothetical protein